MHDERRRQTKRVAETGKQSVMDINKKRFGNAYTGALADALGVKDLSVNAIIAYLEAVERLDPQIVRDAIDDLNPAERARRYH
jgi:hypothetical protein